MTGRREDDQIDPITGVPISAAHQAIYDRLDDCKNELLESHKTMLVEFENRHVRDRHHPPLTEVAQKLGQTPEEMIRNFIAVSQISERVVDALEGPLITGLDGGQQRDKDRGLIAQVLDIQHQMKNGIRHKVQLSTAQWSFAGVLATALATIAVALITGG